MAHGAGMVAVTRVGRPSMRGSQVEVSLERPARTDLDDAVTATRLLVVRDRQLRIATEALQRIGDGHSADARALARETVRTLRAMERARP